jgi:hypothetical protein
MRQLFQEWRANLRAARLVQQQGVNSASGNAPQSVTEHDSLAVEFLERRQLPSVIGTGSGLTGYYYGDQNLTTLRLTRTDPTVNFNWGTGAPAASLPSDHFSARWTGQVQASDSAVYTFYTRSDDGVRLMVDGRTLINDWSNHAARDDSGTISLVAGQKYIIEMDFYENTGTAVAQLSWSRPGLARQIIPTSQLYANPDWFSSHLSDPQVTSLARTLDRDGSLSRNDMIQIFREVENGGVTAAEFGDLRTLVTNAGYLHMPDYVHNLANKVVSGDPANAHYQGQLLGNLHSGSSGAQLEKLVDKWFLGADHPATTGGFSYAVASGTLFGAGPSYTDIRQGLLDDCYFLAGLAETSLRSPATIRNMFIDNGDGTYTVRFFHNGTPDYVTVDKYLPQRSDGTFAYANLATSLGNTNNKLWVALAEKAYAQLAASGWSRSANMPNSYNSITIGWEGDAVNQLTGKQETYQALNNDWPTFNALTGDFESGRYIGIDSRSSVQAGFVPNHVYVLVGYDPASHLFTLYNPWGTTVYVWWGQLVTNFFAWSNNIT